jgi:tetratricopeptide (TPR) repeat protein
MSRLASRTLIIFVLLIAASSSSYAQRAAGQPITGQINGQVRYAQGGTPAFNVLVSCESVGGGLVGQEQTDRNGKFRFSGLKPNQYNVIIHMVGYQDEQQTVDLQTSSTAYLQFQLRTGGARSARLNASPLVIDSKVPAAAREEFERGRAALIDENRMEKGITHLEKAISLYPDFPEAEIMLGTAYMDTRQWDKAESALRRAIEINPNLAVAYFALGELYRQQKKYAEAERVLRDGLKLEDKSWRGHLTLGRVYLDMGTIAKAGPHVGTALRLKPDLAEGHLLAGNILLRAHQPENALVEFEEYLRLSPKGAFSTQTRELVQKIKKGLAEKKR